MTIQELPYRDRKKIEDARKILEQCEEDEAKRFVFTNEVRINLQRVTHFGAYMQGARALLERLLADISTHSLPLSGFSGKDGKVYDAAIVALIRSDLKHLDMYLSGDHQISFRNHQKDKKGRLTSVEAYFTHRVTIDVEST